MFRRVVDREPVPQPAALFFAKPVRGHLAGMGREVVERQVDGLGGGIEGCDVEQELGEVGGCASRRNFGEVASRPGFHGAENIRRSAPFVLVVAASGVARSERRRRLVSACRTTGFSSRQITGAKAFRGCSYTFSTSSMRSI
jgi:hypothetical protein